MPEEPHNPLDDLRASTVLNWLKDYRFIVVGILAALTGAAAGFLATQNRLGNDIEDLRTRIVRNEELRDELGLKTFHLQMSNLRILEDEMNRIQKYVDNWENPKFKDFKPPGMPPPGSLPLEQMVEQEGSNSPVTFDLGSLPSLITSNETRAIRDTELTATIVTILNMLVELNFEITNPGGRPSFGFQAPNPRAILSTHMTKLEADRFSKKSSALISKLEGLLGSGVLTRLRNSRAELHNVVKGYEEKKK